jgi:hypothetical protein
MGFQWGKYNFRFVFRTKLICKHSKLTKKGQLNK